MRMCSNMNVPLRVISPKPPVFAYMNMANPMTAATTPVKSLPAARPRAPPVLP